MDLCRRLYKFAKLNTCEKDKFVKVDMFTVVLSTWGLIIYFLMVVGHIMYCTGKCETNFYLGYAKDVSYKYWQNYQYFLQMTWKFYAEDCLIAYVHRTWVQLWFHSFLYPYCKHLHVKNKRHHSCLTHHAFLEQMGLSTLICLY